jgi:hypothetical protein
VGRSGAVTFLPFANLHAPRLAALVRTTAFGFIPLHLRLFCQFLPALGNLNTLLSLQNLMPRPLTYWNHKIPLPTREL